MQNILILDILILNLINILLIEIFYLTLIIFEQNIIFNFILILL
jgi:hypothetical protein